MKKNVTGIVMAGMLSLLLAGCGSLGKKEAPTPTPRPTPKVIEAATPTPIIWSGQEDSSEDALTSSPTATPKPTEQSTTAPTVTMTPKPTKTPTKAPEPTKKPTEKPKPTATPIPEKMAYEKGVLTEKGFESKWIGLKFSAPEDVVLTSQEELDKIMCLVEEMLYGRQPEEPPKYSEFAEVYEMEAVWKSDDLIMQVIVERLPEGSMSEEEYAVFQKEELAQFAGDGTTYIIDDTLYPVKIGGLEFYNFGVLAEYENGVDVYQEYYIREQDGRMILITFTSGQEMDKQIENALKNFSAY